MDFLLSSDAPEEEDSDEEDWAVCMDGEGRIDGSVGACDTSVAVWDQLLRLRDGTPALAALRAECQLAAWPLASGSFWMPADAEPTCPLERLAQSIFRLHTSGRPFDRARSGAEWWANVTRSETVRRAHDSYGDIAVHLDKDEDTYSRYNLLAPQRGRTRRPLAAAALRLEAASRAWPQRPSVLQSKATASWPPGAPPRCPDLRGALRQHITPPRCIPRSPPSPISPTPARRRSHSLLQEPWRHSRATARHPCCLRLALLARALAVEL